jgi:hypothetical protein
MADTGILGDQLSQLAGTVANKFEPKQFRLALNVGDQGLASWAEKGQYNIVEAQADIKLITPYDTKLPLPTHSRRERDFPVYEFGLGYVVRRGEVDRASADPGYRLDTVLAEANQRKAEETFQAIAAHGGGFADLNGILNLPDASTFNPTDHAASHDSWILQSGAISAGATFDYLVRTMTLWVEAYRDTVLNDMEPNKLILSLNQSKALVTARHSTSPQLTAMEQFLTENPQFRGNVYRWREGNAAGGTNISRSVMYSSSPDCHQFVLVNELTDLPPVNEGIGGYFIPQIMKCGSVISNYPTSVSVLEQTIPASD